MAWVSGSPLRTLGALARIRSVVTGVAAGAGHRRVGHRVGDEARGRIGVAVAALHDAGRNMRRGGQPGGDQTIVAIRAIRIGRLVDIGRAGPACVGGGRAGVTGEAIATAGYDMAWIGCRSLRALGALRGIGTVVAGVAAAAADRRMGHRVGGEARRRVGVAIAALDAGHRNMRRRGVAGRDRPVVAARAIGIARLVGVNAARPAGEGRGRAGVAGEAVASRRRHVAGIRGRAQRALGALRSCRSRCGRSRSVPRSPPNGSSCR